MLKAIHRDYRKVSLFKTPAQKNIEKNTKRTTKLKKAQKVKPVQKGIEETELFSEKGTGKFEFRGIPGDEKGTSQGPNYKEKQRKQKKIGI
jgi:hypothetical protein